MSDPRLAVVILAAGEGTRMKSAVPKVLHPIAGVPLVGHVLATARQLDAAQIVVVVRHDRDRVAATVAELLPEAVIVDQDEVPGTGRAVEAALAGLPADFAGEVVVLSGDVPLLDAATLAELVSAHRHSGALATVLSTVPDSPVGYGRIVRDADGLVERIVEERDALDHERDIDEVNSGSYVFGAEVLRRHLPLIASGNSQGERYLTDVIGLIRGEGGLVGAQAAPSWLVEGVNDRVQLSAAAHRLNAMIVRGWQVAGVTVHDPATTWIDLTTTLAEDVEIMPNTQLSGATTIGRGAIIGPDTTLRDCEVGEDAVISRTDATLAVIGVRAHVGPFAFLRPGSTLDEDGKIGTFVETKNSRIGRGAKVPHLSYIGDAEVGEGSNIGAGTITANYDGVAKHPTTVGSHVKSGSNVVFVAPVSVGDGAYVGAGTTVRQDVPPGALAVNTTPQRNIEGWVALNRPGTAAAEAAAAAETSGADSTAPAAE